MEGHGWRWAGPPRGASQVSSRGRVGSWGSVALMGPRSGLTLAMFLAGTPCAAVRGPRRGRPAVAPLNGGKRNENLVADPQPAWASVSP